jgi:hypothetical protein
LIGATGGPAWYRIGTGKDAAQMTAEPDRVFGLQSWSITMLELLPDPKIDRYCFRAEVRHDQGSETGCVGIYFANHIVPVGKRELNCLYQVTYDDIHGVWTRWNNLPPNIKAITPAPAGNPIRLTVRVHIEDEPGRVYRAEEQGRQGTSIEVGSPTWHFQPAGWGKGPWRKIAVEVTPESVRCFWEGELIYELPQKDLAEVPERLRKAVRNCKQDGCPFEECILPKFNPRKPLGLYLNRGSASFRNVAIEPLAAKK